MPSLRLVLLDLTLVSFYSTSAHAAQPSFTTDSVSGVGSFILQGLGYTTDSASATFESTSISTAFDNKVASPLSSHYYANATASGNATSTVSSSGSITASTSVGSVTTSTTSSSTSTSTYIDTTTSSALVNVTTSSTPQSSYTTFTSLCTENGTLVTHTHSAPITSVGSTALSVSVSAQASNSSSSSLSGSSASPALNVTTSASYALNATTSASSALNTTISRSLTGGLYPSSNVSTSSPFSGPTHTYANSSVASYLNTTNITATPASTTATGPQRTLTTAGPWTVASNGSGYAYASRCNAEWSSYWTTSRTVNSPSLQEYATTYIITNYSAPLTTLCAGNTQINGPLVSTGTLELPWTTQSTVYNATVTLPPEPSCTVPLSQCSAVGVLPGWKYDVPPGCSTTSSCGGPCTIQGSAIQVLYFPLPTSVNATKDVCTASPAGALNSCPYGSWVTSTSTSTMTYTGVTVTGSSISTDSLGITSGGVQVSKIYTTTFVQTMPQCVYSSAGLPGWNNASSVVSNGATFYDNMMYLSFESIWAVNSCGSTIGTPRTGSLIGMPSSDVYSVCTQQAGSVAFPYNVQDLSGYVPQSAWNCQPYCEMVWSGIAVGSGAPSEALPGDTPADLDAYMQYASPGNFYVNDKQVFSTSGGYCAEYPLQEWYKPYIAVPPQVRRLDPAWESCVLALEGWYDPPTTISPATSVAGPSTPTAVYTTAQPGSTQTNALPSSTSTLTTVRSTSPASSAASASPYSSSSISSAAAASPTSATVPIAYSESTISSQVAAASTETTESNAQTSSHGLTASAYSSASGEATTQAISNIISALQPSKSSTPSTSDTTVVVSPSNTPTVPSSYSTAVQSPQPGNASPATSAGAQTAASEFAGHYRSGGLDYVGDQCAHACLVRIELRTNVADRTIIRANDDSIGRHQRDRLIDPYCGPVKRSASYHRSGGLDYVSEQRAHARLIAPASIQTTIVAAGTSVTVSQVSSGAAVVDGSTVSQGSKATINGQTVSVGQSGVQIGTTTVLADPTSSANPESGTSDPGSLGATAVVTANGQTLTAVKYSGSTIVAAGSSTVTLASNDPATISGQQVSVVSGGSGLVVNGGSTATFTYQAPSSSAPQVVTIGSSAYTVAQTSDAHGLSAIVVAAGGSTATLAAGQTTNLGGQTVVAQSSGGAVIGSGSYAATVQPASTPTTLVGGLHTGSTVLYSGSSSLQVIQAGSSVIFAGASSTVTLAQGASTVIAGHSVAAASSNGGAVVDGSSIGLNTPAATSNNAAVTAYSAVVTGSAGRQVTVSQQGSSVVFAAGTSTITLAQGSSTRFAGVSIAADPSAGGVVVGSSTISLGPGHPLATQAVVTASNGQHITALQQGPFVVIAAGTSTITLAQGSSTTFAGVSVAADPNAGGVVVGSSAISLGPAPTVAAQAIVTASNGQQITAVQQGSSVVVAVGGSSITVAQGLITTLAGQTIAAISAGNGVVVDGSTVLLTTPTLATSGAVFTDLAGQSVTILQQGSSYVVQDGTSTHVLPVGSATSVDGMTISAPSTGGAPMVNGQSVTLSSLATTTSELATEAIFAGSASQLATVLQVGSSYVVQDGSSTTTLGAGSTATFDGHTISVPTSGSVAVIDGSALLLSTATQSNMAQGKSSSATTSYKAPASSASSGAGAKSTLASSSISVKTTSISWLIGTGLLLSVIMGCCM
ncbi:hypothetical protein LTR82_008250 [Friedmanniomyces endolithicus]|uniref:Uncharacterized protein n=1 Tax=Friedmanniomyces endolithicus TaxID=329885 RepID=A0AAN6J8N7_9PEZI|nr:hypothetical protein LTR82_008250 [Friedmanniomyces endolithicus]